MLFPTNRQLVFDCLFIGVWLGILVLQLSLKDCRNSSVINSENPGKKRGFLKAGEKGSERVKKPRNVIDQANNLPLTFHCLVLKFLWCEKRIYFDQEYIFRFHKSKD